MFLHEKSHGQRSLEGYSPKGLKESDVTQRLSTEQHSSVNPAAVHSLNWVAKAELIEKVVIFEQRSDTAKGLLTR